MHETDLITKVERVTHQLQLEPIADSKQPEHLLILMKTVSRRCSRISGEDREFLARLQSPARLIKRARQRAVNVCHCGLQGAAFRRRALRPRAAAAL